MKLKGLYCILPKCGRGGSVFRAITTTFAHIHHTLGHTYICREQVNLHQIWESEYNHIWLISFPNDPGRQSDSPPGRRPYCPSGVDWQLKQFQPNVRLTGALHHTTGKYSRGDCARCSPFTAPEHSWTSVTDAGPTMPRSWADASVLDWESHFRENWLITSVSPPLSPPCVPFPVVDPATIRYEMVGRFQDRLTEPDELTRWSMELLHCLRLIIVTLFSHSALFGWNSNQRLTNPSWAGALG